MTKNSIEYILKEIVQHKARHDQTKSLHGLLLELLLCGLVFHPHLATHLTLRLVENRIDVEDTGYAARGPKHQDVHDLADGAIVSGLDDPRTLILTWRLGHIRSKPYELGAPEVTVIAESPLQHTMRIP